MFHSGNGRKRRILGGVIYPGKLLADCKKHPSLLLMRAGIE